MLVTVEELSQTSLYPEIIQKITRGNDLHAERALAEAESLVRSYMSRFDQKSIFGIPNTIPPTAPTFTGPGIDHIKKVIKIIASYYLVRKSNPNVNIELFRADYEDALDWLRELQSGNVNPDLPYPEDDPNTPDDESNRTGVYFHSNNKLTHSF